uniref:(California timema) hypothetical protein n=1 Tax=Timema californicum TaxID=61474 RepID=A0A7R9J2V7_TIMCA|nr:unnamed protein product [Timema californicum]
MISECRKLKKKQSENERKAQVAEVEKAEFSLAANTSLEVDSVLFTSWYLDSGASEHMICATYRHLLTNIHNLPSPANIKLAKSGENLKATEVGDLCASFEMDGKINVIKLGSILIVPGLQHNLLSVRRLDSNGCKGHFVRALGKIGDKDTENEVLLLEHDVPHSKFSEAVLNCLPKLPWVITEEQLRCIVLRTSMLATFITQ